MEEQDGKPDYYTSAEAAKFLGYTQRHITELLKAGRLEGNKRFGKWRIPCSEIDLLTKNPTLDRPSKELYDLLGRWPGEIRHLSSQFSFERTLADTERVFDEPFLQDLISVWKGLEPELHSVDALYTKLLPERVETPWTVTLAVECEPLFSQLWVRITADAEFSEQYTHWKMFLCTLKWTPSVGQDGGNIKRGSRRS